MNTLIIVRVKNSGLTIIIDLWNINMSQILGHIRSNGFINEI